VEIGEDAVKLSMKDAKIFSLDRVLDIEGQKVKYNYLDTGSPHAVIFWDQNDFQRSASYDEYNIETIGRRIRNHKCFEHGVNVNFVYQIDTTTLKNRTYERGVESETMACGTGSVASAIAAAETGRINLPVSIETRSKRTLRIDGEREINGNWRKITLSGPAEEIFRGQFKVNARTNILQAI
jgi:diaminopimelate epimerase